MEYIKITAKKSVTERINYYDRETQGIVNRKSG